MSNVYDEVMKIWELNEDKFERKLLKWAEAIEENRDKLLEDRRRFREWSPFKVYVSCSGAAHSMFSLRFHGQEVGTLEPQKDGIFLRINEKNRSFLGTGTYPWRSEEAKQFREHFKNEEIANEFKTRIPEHGLESTIITEMRKRTRAKFNGTFRGIQPVMINGCPFQMPLPISGSSGKPKPTHGHIDILARRREEGGKVRLSVWELKDKGKVANAVRQVSIYAVTLLLMLRKSSAGEKWWKIFGFNGDIPSKIEIEAVMAVDKSSADKLRRQWRAVRQDLPLKMKEGTINYYAAFYDLDGKTIRVEPLPEN